MYWNKRQRGTITMDGMDLLLKDLHPRFTDNVMMK